MLRGFLLNLRISLRMWVRKRSRPLTLVEAEEKKLFWSKVYMLCGFMTFVYAVRSSFTDDSLLDFSQSFPISKKIVDRMDEKEEFRFVTLSGFKKVGDDKMTKEDLIKQRNQELEESQAKK